MSSNFEIQRICKFCGRDFIARTTVTRCCSKNCTNKYYKSRQRAAKIEASNKETLIIKAKPLSELQAKEFLTVKEVASLLNCSVRTAYNLIDNKRIKAVNISERKTLVKRSEIDKLFS
ncbi:MAG TPA: helix-turn-helix domain-containing protein [Bacteroidia bacterium]|jgi:excisionase family DNA binding protein|nr:helix-turn-helix domain-containing protein [Bacteroidia bacterium]